MQSKASWTNALTLSWFVDPWIHTLLLFSRPTHWQRPNAAKSAQPRVPMSAELSAQRKRSRMDLLKTSSVHSRIHAISSHSSVGAHLHHNDVPQTTATGNRSDSQQTSTNMQEPDRVTITTEQLRSMIYRPPTMPKPRVTEEVSSQREHEDEPLHSVATVNRPNYTTPAVLRRQSSSKNKSGPWTKRLALIKSEETTNVMKLQHAGMCRHGVSFDLNDPRKKAKTCTDVTIVSNVDSRGVAIQTLILRPTPGASSSCDDTLITVSSFIHDHRPINGNISSKSVTSSFAWISFRQTTARNIGLEQGMPLRLYDAVLLPIQQSESMKDSSTDTENVAEHRFVIICTQFCERHPTGWGPIPP